MNFTKKLKKIIAVTISILLYLGLVDFIILIPKFVKSVLNFSSNNLINNDTVLIMIIVIILLFFSSDFIYMTLHKFYVKQFNKNSFELVKFIFISLISFNDFFVSIPKRTIIFMIYLFLTVASRLGYMYENIDFMFLGVFLIGLDRVTQSWKKEKAKLFSFGEKAYGNDSDITDDLVGK